MDARGEQGKEPSAGGSSEETLVLVVEVEGELNELKAAYEQYFLGYERLPPLKKHEAVKKRIKALKGAMARQTALRFRIDSLAQKLLTYERLWDRTMKEIEAGTYRRDLFKAKLQAQRRLQKAPQRAVAGDDGDHAFDIDEHLDLTDLDEGELDPALSTLSEADSAGGEAGEGSTFAELEASMSLFDPSAASLDAVRRASSAASKASSAPAVPPVAPAVKAGSAPAVPPVAPAVKGGSAPGVPAVTPVAKTGSAPAVPAVAPVAKTGSAPAVPAVAPAVKGGSAPAVPAVAPLAKTGSVPAVPAVAKTGSVPGVAPSTKAAVSSGAAASSSGLPGTLSEAQLAKLYDAYMTAKRRCGEDVAGVTLSTMADTLRKQLPAILKQHNVSSVEFKVVIKDGKAVLRAVPK